MNKQQAQEIARGLNAAGMIDIDLRHYGGGSYDLTATDLKTGINFVIISPEAWEERKRAAATLGRAGGSVTSDAKAAASRENGKRGGRPRKG